MATRLRVRRSRVLAATAVAVIVGSGVAARPAAADGPTLLGTGSSFMALEMDQWRAEVARAPYKLTINYAAQGSGAGRQQFQSGNVDFAGSDIPYTQNELASPWAAPDRKNNFVYVPVSAGGLGIMYNLIDTAGNKVTNLRLTRRAVCRMFTEPSMSWNDPEIQNANPDISLPAEQITPVVRQDRSGTSYIMAQYCIIVAP